MATEAQILSSLSPNVVVGDPVGTLDRNQRKNLRSFDYFLCKTNPIQTQSKPVLSAVEWANLRRNECKLLCCRVL